MSEHEDVNLLAKAFLRAEISFPTSDLMTPSSLEISIFFGMIFVCKSF